MRSRRELFPPDLALTARMVLAGVLTPALLVAALVALVAFGPWRIVAGVALASVVGVVAVLRVLPVVPLR